jgi:hypothetical protein
MGNLQEEVLNQFRPGLEDVPVQVFDSLGREHLLGWAGFHLSGRFSSKMIAVPGKIRVFLGPLA